jgi:hypothetical protein
MPDRVFPKRSLAYSVDRPLVGLERASEPIHGLV